MSWQYKPAPGVDAKMPSHQEKRKNELHALMDQEINCHVTQEQLKKQHHAADDELVHAFEQLSISNNDRDSSHLKKDNLDDKLYILGVGQSTISM
jgi:hypothetical protein